MSTVTSDQSTNKSKSLRRIPFKDWPQEKKDAKYAAAKKWIEKNKEKFTEYHRKRREKDWDKMRAQKKAWYYAHRDYVIARAGARHKRLLAEDPVFRLSHRLRTRLWTAVKGHSKSARTMELIGCSVDELISHLKSKFTDGMTLENYGEWHVDHIVPCALFDLSDPEQQKKCFHYTNLQPLWAKDNMDKRRVDGSLQFCARNSVPNTTKLQPRTELSATATT